MSKPMDRRTIFREEGFVITEWFGNKGDYSTWYLEGPVKREDKSSISFVTSGSFSVWPPEGSGLPRWYHRAGEHSGNLPDFAVAGEYIVVAEEDKSVEVCCCRVGPSGAPSMEDFWWDCLTAKTGDQFRVPIETLILLGSGKLVSDSNKKVEAPMLVYVHMKPTTFTFVEDGQAMLYRRVPPDREYISRKYDSEIKFRVKPEPIRLKT